MNEPEWHWGPKTMLGFLAQAFDEGVPEGATGFDAARAIALFMQERGFVIVPRKPTQEMHVGAEDVTDRPCWAMLNISKHPMALDVPTPSALACQVWERMIVEFQQTGNRAND